jgi:hypothetical protein
VAFESHLISTLPHHHLISQHFINEATKHHRNALYQMEQRDQMMGSWRGLMDETGVVSRFGVPSEEDFRASKNTSGLLEED